MADAEQIAHFEATLWINFDPAEQTPEEALDEYIANNDVSQAFELQKVEDR